MATAKTEKKSPLPFPYVREWFEQKLGNSFFVKTTRDLSGEQVKKVKGMVSAKKFVQIVAGLPTNYNSNELQKIAIELFGDISFVRVLYFHPIHEKDSVDFLLSTIWK